MPPAHTTAGSTGAISAPMVIRMRAAGDNSYCLGCRGYFLETLGTPFHGKHVEPDTLVWAIAALAEGLGIRAVARIFEADPNTFLGWLVEAADHLEAFSRFFVHDVDVEQVQMDELFALLSVVKDGEVTEAPGDQALVPLTPLGVGGDGPSLQAYPDG